MAAKLVLDVNMPDDLDLSGLVQDIQDAITIAGGELTATRVLGVDTPAPDRGRRLKLVEA